MPARLFIGYFVALAACATIAFASGIDSSGTPGGPAFEQRASWQPLPASAFHVHPHKLLFKHVQVAQAE